MVWGIEKVSVISASGSQRRKTGRALAENRIGEKSRRLSLMQKSGISGWMYTEVISTETRRNSNQSLI